MTSYYVVHLLGLKQTRETEKAQLGCLEINDINSLLRHSQSISRILIAAVSLVAK